MRVARYEKSFGNAAAAFEESSWVLDIRLARTVDVSRGIGSSGFVDWARRGKKGLYGSGCSATAFESAGIAADI